MVARLLLIATVIALASGQTGRCHSQFDAPWRPGDPTTNASIPLEEGLDYLRKMLQVCLEVEHSVIPLYLSAYYSIKNQTSWAAQIIRGVAVEEMLHMTTAANVLNAVGGSPQIDRPGFVPNYPEVLPVLNVSVSIAPFSRNSALQFRVIERPAAIPEQPFMSTWEPTRLAPAESIAVFYQYASGLMQRLCQLHGETSVLVGNHSLQVNVSSPSLHQEAGPVYSLADAVAALTGVVDQGAGISQTNISAGPDGGGFAHFVRFDEIYNERLYLPNDTTITGPTGPSKKVNWTDVYEFEPNPSLSDYSNHTAEWQALNEFARNYTDVLVGLHQVFNGDPDSFMSQLGQMYQLGAMARSLMSTPDPNHPGKGLGPAWAYLPERSKFNGTCPDLSL